MNIEITASETFLDQEERAYIQRRLENSLGENIPGIEQVQVWIIGILLADEDEAQYCLINVKLADGSLVACDGTHATLKTAINHAVERVSLEVARNLRPRRKHSLEHIHRSAGSYRKVTKVEYRPDRL